jgi:hypothetical protein
MTAPSAWTLQQVMSIAQATLARMEADGTLDTDEVALMDALRQEVPEVDDVLVRLLRAMGEARANAVAVGERVKSLEDREARYVRQAESYRAAVSDIFDALGMTKWRHAEFSASVSERRPGVSITDEAALPDEFVRIERKPDKAKIKEAIARGAHVPGVTVENNPPVMTIRTK